MVGLTGLARPEVIDAIIPARNEELTVADVVAAARSCRYVREVIVVDDGSSDETADRAMAAGAKVVERGHAFSVARTGSKAHAMAAGAAASDADAFLFVDADLLGLAGGHLDRICEPVLEGRAAMSVGWFDYGRLNPLVRRLPPTTGQRLVPRRVFEAVPSSSYDGFTIEYMINQVVAESRLETTALTMPGVTHLTKRDKFGLVEGYRATWRMFQAILGLPVRGVVRWRCYLFYLRRLTVLPSVPRRVAGWRRARAQARRSVRRRAITLSASVSSAPSKMDSTRASTK